MCSVVEGFVECNGRERAANRIGMVARIPQAPEDNDAVDGPALLWRKGRGIDHWSFDAAHTSRGRRPLYGAPRSADTGNVESHQRGLGRPFLGQFRGLEHYVRDFVVSG